MNFAKFLRTPPVAASGGQYIFISRGFNLTKDLSKSEGYGLLFLKVYLEEVIRRCSVKNMLLKISQNSQENTCVRVYFLKKRLFHGCFPVNFVKFLRTPFCTEHLRWLLLYIFSYKKFTSTYENSITSKRRCKCPNVKLLFGKPESSLISEMRRRTAAVHHA